MKQIIIFTLFLFSLNGTKAMNDPCSDVIIEFNCSTGNYDFYVNNPNAGPVVWNFGDNQQGSSVGNGIVSHSYNNSGYYEVSVSYPGVTCVMASKFYFGISETLPLSSLSMNLNTTNGFDFEYSGVGFTVPTGFLYEFSIDFGDQQSDQTVFESGESISVGDVIFSHNYSSNSNTTFNPAITLCVYENPLLLPKSNVNSLNNFICCEIDFEFEYEYVPSPCCSNFAPIVGERYWMSAWVKEDHLNQVKTYEDSYVEFEFIGNGSTVKFYPTGDIIDGWQRIVGDFVIPTNTTDLQIHLANDSQGITAFFDDVRVHPFNGSMKSYVYDPVTLWLTAELDDNNYATFYEYDSEGQLIRIKKETSRGIMTIQESRSSNPKSE